MQKKKYLLFNPATGVHTSFDTLEQLHASREILLKIELEQIRKRYTILEEVFYPNGDSETRPYLENIQRSVSELKLTFSHPVPNLTEKHHLIKKTETI